MRMMCLAMLLLLLPLAAQAETYQNPIEIEGQHGAVSRSNAMEYGIGDPFIMRYNGMYYLYPSSNEDKVRVFTSRDLVHWTYEGYCTQGKDVYFAYAPEVVYWRGSFYMCTSPSGSGHYILRSDSPLGPFTKVTDNFGHVIDGSFFVQDDGQLLFIYPEDWVIRAKYIDEATLRPESIRFSLNATLKHWTEGPGLIRRGDWYYLTFTGNHLCSTGYRVAYASQKGATPFGTYYQREDCTLLIHSVFGQSPQALGHSSMCIGPDLDSIYTAYHNMLILEGPARRYNLDRLFTNGGLMYTSGPTSTDMAVPAMPDVWGDLDGDSGSFENTEIGWFASLQDAQRFTQECNYTGEALWQMGQAAGQDVLVRVDGSHLKVLLDDTVYLSAFLPPLGEDGRLHTLRIEHQPGDTCFYIDGMRVLRTDVLEVTAGQIGAHHVEGTSYHFAGATAQAFGSSDYTAQKTLPGNFAAVHAVNYNDFATQIIGTQEEQALLLNGTALYTLRAAQDGFYCYDITVRPEDAGKTLTLSLDGAPVLEVMIPAYTGKKAELFTFTTPAFEAAAGLHVLSVTGQDITLSKLSGFAYQAVTAAQYDFTTKVQRGDFVVLGAFKHTPTEGTLSISSGKVGFALLGDEGYTDYEVYVRFKIPRKGTGASGLMLRATNVSLYDAQVKESYFGWQIGLSMLGVNVSRCRYGVSGSVEFVSMPAWKDAEEGELTLRVQGGTLSILLPGQEQPVFTVTDAGGFTHGMAGLFSTGKELTILEMNITPLAGE